jgi:hypothetical protein
VADPERQLMKIRHQYEIRSQYEEVRRHRPKLAPWDKLGDDGVFALLRSYEAGLRDGGRAAKQPERSSNGRQAVLDPLRCPTGTTPQRSAPFRTMFDAIFCKLVPDGVVEDDVFKGMHQHMVRMAIADLAATLLTYAIDDTDQLDNSVWTALIDEIRDEMRAKVLAEVGDVPFPTWQ